MKHDFQLQYGLFPKLRLLQKNHISELSHKRSDRYQKGHPDFSQRQSIFRSSSRCSWGIEMLSTGTLLKLDGYVLFDRACILVKSWR